MQGPARHRSARSWKHAGEIVREYAAGRRLEFGVGNRYRPGAVLAVKRDGLNEGRGYRVADVDEHGEPTLVFVITIDEPIQARAVDANVDHRRDEGSGS